MSRDHTSRYTPKRCRPDGCCHEKTRVASGPFNAGSNLFQRVGNYTLPARSGPEQPGPYPLQAGDRHATGRAGQDVRHDDRDLSTRLSAGNAANAGLFGSVCERYARRPERDLTFVI
jgi:hypothetical protein